jgi:hypothetical protein
MSSAPEAWLSGPVEGVIPYLIPVAHALVQAGPDLENARSGPRGRPASRPRTRRD